MEQMIVLRRKAVETKGLGCRVLGRIAFPGEDCYREDCLLLVRRTGNPIGPGLADGFAAVLVEEGASGLLPEAVNSPMLSGLADLSGLTQGSVVAVSPNGSAMTLYRPESPHNAIFATARCNSNCLMCSQPPAEDDADADVIAEHLRLIELIEEPPDALGITGGEPTLLGDGLVAILSAIKQRFPETAVHMLTNGRKYADGTFVAKVAASAPRDFVSAMPLYADTPDLHDWIVQAKDAFAETMAGFYNAARNGLRVEIRVVLHKQTIPRLVPLMGFIYRNLPFVGHIALMGLENMGYVKKNREILWIDPLDYAGELEDAVKALYYRGMRVSIYNLPLCVLPKSVWPFARQSISDYKNLYLDECSECAARRRCSGLFASSKSLHSRGIHSFGDEPSGLDLCL